MGQRDQFGRRVTWTPAEKKMVREMKEAGLQPCRPILSYRSKAEKLGKRPIPNPSTEDTGFPPHLQKFVPKTPKVRSVMVIPDAFGAGPSNLPQQSVPQAVTGPYVALSEEDDVLPDDDVTNDADA